MTITVVDDAITRRDGHYETHEVRYSNNERVIYALDNMTIENTRAPLTTGRVVSVLPWLPSRDKNLRQSDAKFSKDVLPVEKIGRPSFIRTRP